MGIIQRYRCSLHFRFFTRWEQSNATAVRSTSVFSPDGNNPTPPLSAALPFFHPMGTIQRHRCSLHFRFFTRREQSTATAVHCTSDLIQASLLEGGGPLAVEGVCGTKSSRSLHFHPPVCAVLLKISPKAGCLLRWKESAKP